MGGIQRHSSSPYGGYKGFMKRSPLSRPATFIVGDMSQSLVFIHIFLTIRDEYEAARCTTVYGKRHEPPRPPSLLVPPLSFLISPHAPS